MHVENGKPMKLQDIDLNLLRLFDAVYRARSVSRAAEQLNITQPAASQGLTRLRLLVGDALFVRAPGGVSPTPRAQRLAAAVRQALATLEEAFGDTRSFDPATARRSFRIHLSDIGEARFLPPLMAALHRTAPLVRLETFPVPHSDITEALDTGRLDFALGFLPGVADTRHRALLSDRYIVLMRAGHPFAGRGTRIRRTVSRFEDLQQLDFAAVRSHSETLRILQLLKLEDRLRLTAAHFLALPAIVRETDLAVLMPRSIARGFSPDGGYVIVEPRFPLRDFTVSLHWSPRFEADPGNQWLREQVIRLFAERN
jgi:DNA-binding transcriptional LysR family regulator